MGKTIFTQICTTTIGATTLGSGLLFAASAVSAVADTVVAASKKKRYKPKDAVKAQALLDASNVKPILFKTVCCIQYDMEDFFVQCIFRYCELSGTPRDSLKPVPTPFIDEASVPTFL